MVPCVRFKPFVQPVFRLASYGPATLGTGGWLRLTRQGLTPCKKRQACLGAHDHGGNGALTLGDYETLDGVQGSIEAAVAEAFAAPDAAPRIPAGAAKRESLLKPAFVPHLMGVNEANGEPVRRTARRADLPETARGLIDRLIAQRLLVADRRGEETVIEVAHEALLRRWPTLRRWHDQERAALVTQQEIARAASAWSQNAGGGTDWLAHRGVRLAEAEKVARRRDFAAAFEGAPRAYLDACRQAEDTAREAEAQRLARQRAMQRRVGILLTIVAVVTLVGGGLVVAGRRDLSRQRSGLIVLYAKAAFEDDHYDRALRLALAASRGSWFVPASEDAGILLGYAARFSRLEAQLSSQHGWMWSASFSPDGDRIGLVFFAPGPLLSRRWVASLSVLSYSPYMPQPPIGPALRVLRQRRNLRQYQVAKAAGVTKAMLSAFETGKHLPATRSIIAVLDALGADFGDLQRVLDHIAGRLPKYPEADPEFRAALRALAKSFDSFALMLRTLAAEDQEAPSSV